MKFNMGSKGAVLITLIATITVISTLSVVLFSMQAASMYIGLNENEVAQAYYLAEWGIRYAKENSFSPGNYLTMSRKSDGTFYWIIDSSPPPSPHETGGMGVRVKITGPGIESTGIVNEGGSFEAAQTIFD